MLLLYATDIYSTYRYYLLYFVEKFINQNNSKQMEFWITWLAGEPRTRIPGFRWTGSPHAIRLKVAKHTAEFQVCRGSIGVVFSLFSRTWTCVQRNKLMQFIPLREITGNCSGGAKKIESAEMFVALFYCCKPRPCTTWRVDDNLQLQLQNLLFREVRAIMPPHSMVF
jgi:hypothetical protein